MPESTTNLLAGLSHQWHLHVLGFALLSGVLAVYFGRKLARKTEPAHWLKFVHRLSIGLLILSIPLAALSISHIGCSVIVSNSTACRSNLKQLGTSMMIYAQDYDERLPPSTNWEVALKTSLRKAEPFRCPSAQSHASYAMNAKLGGVSISTLVDPWNTVLLFDSNARTRSFAGSKEHLAIERHGRVPNFAFADGHVKGATPALQEKAIWIPALENGRP